MSLGGLNANELKLSNKSDRRGSGARGSRLCFMLSEVNDLPQQTDSSD